MNKNVILFAIMALAMTHFLSLAAGERVNIDDGWKFSFGNIDPQKDFGAGTEYFNYLTKANSIHNAGPYAKGFNDSAWVSVNLPFDFVVDLPFAREASHSHGYKTVGYKYPATSVGWYRKVFPIECADTTDRVYITFDGIFRDSRVWFNGFYLGGEPSGYAQQRYDVTPYVNWGGDNLLAVRADATFEEGWFYEGGGIYRHAWMERYPSRHFVPNSVAVVYASGYGNDADAVDVSGEIAGCIHDGSRIGNLSVVALLRDASGSVVAQGDAIVAGDMLPASRSKWNLRLEAPGKLRRWNVDDPYMYTVELVLRSPGAVADTLVIPTGFRTVEFDADKGLLLNGKRVKIKGVNMHQDHAGVGVGITDGLNAYRLKELKKYGVNAYRASHNPMTPEVLAACDSLGIMVIEENRLLGTNDYHVGQLRRMIDRDRNHPSIILWCVGNEEWGVEWDKKSEKIVQELNDIVAILDPTREMTVASSSGPNVVINADVAGYNYIVQNPVDEHRRNYPFRKAYGSEETSGCGTRGVYFDDAAHGYMQSLNRKPDIDVDSCLNRIERGWKFYDERPWLAGLFYWTGFDYRGEPNPLSYPATGSEFGILDYCGFPKDEAFYLKSWWTDEPVLHILPHWNLEGHEGEQISVWVYSNMDEVELIVNGKKLGRKIMPRNGHLEWTAIYSPGKVEAHGYKDGKRVMTSVVETAGKAEKIEREVITEADGTTIVNVTLRDAKGRFVPTACEPVTITYPAGTTLLGAGNGDPAFLIPERPEPGTEATTFTIPSFNGHAQFILTSADFRLALGK